MAKIWKVTFHCTHTNGVLVEPSFHYQTDLPAEDPLQGEPDPLTVASAVWGHLSGFFLQSLSDDITVHESVATEVVIPPAVGESGVHNVGVAGQYPLATGNLSHAMVPLINIHTTTASRSARGWVFGGAPRRAEDCNGDLWNTTTAFYSAWTDFAGVIPDSIRTAGTDLVGTFLRPVVYSRTRHKRGQNPYTFHVVSALPNPQTRWLKSRLSSP